jgi:hypothetical protein
MVVVALGEPGTPVVWVCALTEGVATITKVASIPLRLMNDLASWLFSLARSLADCFLHSFEFARRIHL